LLGAACFFYSFAYIFVPGVPMLLLARWTAIEGLAAAALFGRELQWGGAGGAICEDHFSLR
jgi:hypothetical protein